MFKNMQGLMKQAQQMQEKMNAAQEAVAQHEEEGMSGAGLVKVKMNGKNEIKSLKIDEKIVDPNDIEMLEDLIVAAINDAKNKVDAYSSAEMGKVTEGLPLPSGFKLPF